MQIPHPQTVWNIFTQVYIEVANSTADMMRLRCHGMPIIFQNLFPHGSCVFEPLADPKKYQYIATRWNE
jgi:hypothetical protein